MDFLERRYDVVEVGLGAEEQILFEPRTLFVTQRLGIGAADIAVRESFGRRSGKIRAEGAMEKQRLTIKREAVAA